MSGGDKSPNPLGTPLFISHVLVYYNIVVIIHVKIKRTTLSDSHYSFECALRRRKIYRRRKRAHEYIKWYLVKYVLFYWIDECTRVILLRYYTIIVVICSVFHHGTGLPAYNTCAMTSRCRTPYTICPSVPGHKNTVVSHVMIITIYPASSYSLNSTYCRALSLTSKSSNARDNNCSNDYTAAVSRARVAYFVTANQLLCCERTQCVHDVICSPSRWPNYVAVMIYDRRIG